MLKPFVKPISKTSIRLNGVSNGLIYHYTTATAFQRIIRSGVFHLSDYRDLKDNDELRWAFEQFHNAISHLFPTHITFSSLLPINYYVFCTCLRHDNKYLWENYASHESADNSGVVISINAEALYEECNVERNFIHMTSMNYDSDAYVNLCKESFEGLPPIALASPLMIGTELNKYREEHGKFLNHFPGYAQFVERRQKILELASFQKRTPFAKEEEIRILNWHEINNPLPTRIISEKTKSLLPWRGKEWHCLKEIIRLPTCKLSEGTIKRFLRENRIEAEVKTLDPEQLF